MAACWMTRAIWAAMSALRRPSQRIRTTEGELEHLTEIVILQLEIFLPELRPIRVQGNGFHDAAHGQAHATDAMPPVRDVGIDSYAIEGLVHVSRGHRSSGFDSRLARRRRTGERRLCEPSA
jgi:hypothetical protein